MKANYISTIKEQLTKDIIKQIVLSQNTKKEVCDKFLITSQLYEQLKTEHRQNK